MIIVFVRIRYVVIPWRGLRSLGDDVCDVVAALPEMLVVIPWRGLRSLGGEKQVQI